MPRPMAIAFSDENLFSSSHPPTPLSLPTSSLCPIEPRFPFNLKATLKISLLMKLMHNRRPYRCKRWCCFSLALMLERVIWGLILGINGVDYLHMQVQWDISDRRGSKIVSLIRKLCVSVGENGARGIKFWWWWKWRSLLIRLILFLILITVPTSLAFEVGNGTLRLYHLVPIEDILIKFEGLLDTLTVGSNLISSLIFLVELSLEPIVCEFGFFRWNWLAELYL